MSLTDAYMAVLKQMQAEGKIILPGELVRRVKAGPGPDSLGQAQHAASLQSAEQQGIESDTLTAVGRLESAWSGQSGDAARGSLRPLADVAASASMALHDSQNTLADQSHAFTSTRDSLHDVSDTPPSRSGWDVATPWDTDTEKNINARNAAVEQNNAAYQGFTGTSDGHAQKMPIAYGDVPDSSNDTYALTPAQGPGKVGGTQDPRQQQITARDHQADSSRPVGHSGSTAAPPPSGNYSAGQHPAPDGQQPPAYVPAAAHGGDSTHTSGYVPPGSTGVNNTPAQFGPTGTGTGYVPGSGPGGSSSYSSPGYLGGVPGSFGPGGGTGTRGSGNGSPGASVRGGGPGEAGKSTGAGRFSEPEPGTRGGASTGAAGAKGANGMPMAGGAGKGGKGEEDKEKKAASYLQEADPNALFGYDGKATPPVIGK